MAAFGQTLLVYVTYMWIALKIYSARNMYYRFSALIASTRMQPIFFTIRDKHICDTIYTFALSLPLLLFRVLFRFFLRSFSPSLIFSLTHSLTHSFTHSLSRGDTSAYLAAKISNGHYAKGDDVNNNININNDDDVS